MVDETKESKENQETINLENLKDELKNELDIDISNEENSLITIVEMKNIFDKCQKFYIEKEITLFELKKELEDNVLEKGDIYTSAYLQVYRNEWESKLFKINSNLVKTIEKENKKYGALVNIFIDWPFLLSLYSTITSKKCKNFIEATNLYFENEYEINTAIKNAKYPILERTTNIKKGNQIGDLNIKAITLLPAIILLILCIIIPEDIEGLKIFTGILSILLFIGFGLWKFIVKFFLKDIFQKMSENYIKENLFSCIENTIKKVFSE